MIKEFKAGERRYGIIEGATHSIITESDCCHVVESNDSNIVLDVEFGFSPLNGRFAIKDLIMDAQPIENIRKWIHYFGIKDRVRYNYGQLIMSMREIGVDTSTMPEWSRER